MLDELKALNANLVLACADGEALTGCTFYANVMQEFQDFPAVGTKLMSIDVLPTNSGTVIPQDSEVILYVSDLLSNHADIVTLYDETIIKLNIILGLVDGTTTDNIDIIDTFFQGSKKGVTVAISINI